MKLALIGTGKIVQEALMALQEIPAAKIARQAIFGRPHSREKAEAMAAEFGIAKVYTDYAELLADPAIDFVYIGLVNSAHYSYTKQALMAGKNVILEKPSTSSYSETKELADLAVANGLYLFEAVTLLHMPNFRGIQAALDELGDIKLIQCNYSQYSSRYDAYKEGTVLPALDPSMYGGALYDINIYNLNFVIGLFGAPRMVHYMANKGFNGVDTSGVLVLQYTDFTAVCVGAKDSDSPCGLTIQGDKGYIHVEGAPNVLTNFTLSVGGRTETKQLNTYEHRMVHEFLSFFEIYEKKDYARMEAGLEISKLVIQTAEQAGQSAGIPYGRR